MRKIIHVDMDAFFASVEQREHPEWRGKPVIVGGSVRERGVVSTCSYEARQFGVHSAMPTSQALRLCPKAILVSPNFKLYKEVSQQVHQIFQSVTPLVESLSIDEAFLDVTENSLQLTSATLVAREIQRMIFAETGLTCSVGVSFNKFLAKVASGHHKPSGITVIDEASFPSFIQQLAISDFYGVGKISAEKLMNYGIRTGGDLLEYSKEWLVRQFGKQGEALYHQVRGASNDQLTLHRERKSYGKEVTLQKDTTDEQELLQYLQQFAVRISTALQKQQKAAKTITLKLKDSQFKVNTYSKTLRNYINDEETILYEATNLLEAVYQEEEIRLIGLSVSNMEKTANIFTQLTLF